VAELSRLVGVLSLGEWEQVQHMLEKFFYNESIHGEVFRGIWDEITGRQRQAIGSDAV
jgi:hypothetical protein